jgi:hypothetical protein
MTGFLSVLDPPVLAPHLQQLGVATASASTVSGNEHWSWVSARANLLLAQLRRQDETLHAITEIARRIHQGAARLGHHAEAVRRIRSRRASFPERIAIG